MCLPQKHLEQKGNDLKKDRHILKQSNDRLSKRIDKQVVSETVEINSETSDVVLIKVVDKKESRFPPNSPRHLFVGAAKETANWRKSHQ